MEETTGRARNGSGLFFSFPLVTHNRIDSRKKWAGILGIGGKELNSCVDRWVKNDKMKWRFGEWVAPTFQPKQLSEEYLMSEKSTKVKLAKKTVAEDLSGVSIEFGDGKELTANLADFSDDIVIQLALHGLSQKMGDSYSGEKDVTVARTKAEGVVDRLKAGDWKAVRESSGGGRITDLAQALAQVTGRSVEDATRVVAEMSKEDKSSLRKNAQIKVALQQIALKRAEEAAKKDDGEDGGMDLGGLMADAAA